MKSHCLHRLVVIALAAAAMAWVTPLRAEEGHFDRTLQVSGPVELEVIGARGYDLVACQAIASESRGHLQACMQACGER